MLTFQTESRLSAFSLAAAAAAKIADSLWNGTSFLSQLQTHQVLLSGFSRDCSVCSELQAAAQLRRRSSCFNTCSGCDQCDCKRMFQQAAGQGDFSCRISLGSLSRLGLLPLMAQKVPQKFRLLLVVDLWPDPASDCTQRHNPCGLRALQQAQGCSSRGIVLRFRAAGAKSVPSAGCPIFISTTSMIGLPGCATCRLQALHFLLLSLPRPPIQQKKS